MSHSPEQDDHEVFTLDHLFHGVPDLTVPAAPATGAADDDPEDADPPLPGPR